MSSNCKYLQELKVLSIGSFSNYGASNTCTHRTEAMEGLGVRVVRVDSAHKKSFCRKIGYKLFCYGLPVPLPHGKDIRTKVIEALGKESFDIIWIDKGLIIDADLLHWIKKNYPACKIVGYSPDDMKQRHSQSQQFLKALPCYDVFFTTKSYNVSELQQMGCPKVIFVGNAYSDKFHYPRELSEADRQRLGGDVGFIGAYEKERAGNLLYLAQNGISVRVWGRGWNKFKETCPDLKIENRPLDGDVFPMGLCAFEINLGFLRKINRDLQTTRTMEIPACRAFMLAERTSEHLSLFKEGKEAEFFDSNEELLEKCRYYLDNPLKRREIAENGYQRCIKSGYSNIERMRFMLNELIFCQPEKQKSMKQSILVYHTGSIGDTLAADGITVPPDDGLKIDLNRFQVKYFFRKRTTGYSIEGVFDSIIKALPAGVNVERIEVKYADASWRSILRNMFFCCQNQEKINHITGDIHYCAILLKKKHTILTVHDLVLLGRTHGLKYFFAWLLWFYIPVKRSQIVTCISNATREDLLSKIKCNPDKVVVVYDPVNPAFIQAHRKFNNPKPVIIHFTNGENKNLHRTIPALQEVSCHLRIIGKLKETHLRLLKKNKIEYSNICNISTDQIIEEYKKCDIVCFPSTYEGFGMPIIEAQATGRVVLSSDIPPMPEVGGNGAYYVDPYNIESINNGIRQLISNTNLREKLIAAGTENVKRFTVAAIAKDYIKIYNLINKPK